MSRDDMTGKRYLPAWKDKAGNRLVFIAENHVHETDSTALEFQIANFLFYIPLGVTTDGIFEVDLQDGRANFPHVVAQAPYNFQAAIISGPAFDAAMAAAAAECVP